MTNLNRGPRRTLGSSCKADGYNDSAMPGISEPPPRS